MFIGQRVNTKYGPGTVSGFERISTVIEHPVKYAPGDRIAVQLDTPENWPIYSVTSGNPYFYENELKGA